MFRFQAAWTSHPDFLNVVNNSWNDNGDIDDNLNNLKRKLMLWNKNNFGNIFARKKRLMARLEGIQRKLTQGHSTGLIKLERKIRQELQATLYQEELYWYQQSREEWIVSGDRNTKFYHAATSIRKSRRKVCSLKNHEGDIITDQDVMKDMMFNFFTNLFAVSPGGYVQDISRNCFPKLEDTEWTTINAPLTNEEIKMAVFAMAPYKAPGPDGYHAGFYQHAWTRVSESVITHVKNFWSTGVMQDGLNDTMISLIPKVSNLELTSQFRPISLCNVKYKIITKVMANRIKQMLHKTIGKEQSSFVPGRQISDNIAVYQEVLHTMRRKQGNKGLMMLKIDLEKAYDRISWDFIRDTLVEVGFNEIWVRNIMCCVETARLSIVWNREALDWIIPKRGIRQGDAISPYIFVLCIERLSHMIHSEVNKRKWRGIRTSRHGPLLTHLFFADDLVLFSEASQDQIKVIKECLDKFSAASGQKVSLSKSQIFFSNNVSAGEATNIVDAAGIPRTTELGKHLGVPSLHGRVTKNLFAPMIERVNNRLEGWKMRVLSMAGRQVLVKSTLSSIPYYTMQTTLLPAGICDWIDRKVRGFLWGSNEAKRKCHLVKWDKVTQSKEEGGLGIRTAREMNLALLGKMCWRVIKEKDTLWTEIIKHKYGDGSNDIGNIVPRKGSSNMWRGITTALPFIRNGFRFHIHNGKQTRFWKDCWIEKAPLERWIINGGETESEVKVTELWQVGDGWRRESFRDMLQENILTKLELITVSENKEDHDDVSWNMEHSGTYSVTSAYHLIKNGMLPAQDFKWEDIWKLRVPEKMKLFTWVVMHGRVLCNEERRRRGLTSDNKCPCCRKEVESIDNIFRKCSRAKRVWRKLMPRMEFQRSESITFKEWVSTNLEGRINRNDKKY